MYDIEMSVTAKNVPDNNSHRHNENCGDVVKWHVKNIVKTWDFIHAFYNRLEELGIAESILPREFGFMVLAAIKPTSTKFGFGNIWIKFDNGYLQIILTGLRKCDVGIKVSCRYQRRIKLWDDGHRCEGTSKTMEKGRRMIVDILKDIIDNWEYDPDELEVIELEEARRERKR